MHSIDLPKEKGVVLIFMLCFFALFSLLSLSMLSEQILQTKILNNYIAAENNLANAKLAIAAAEKKITSAKFLLNHKYYLSDIKASFTITRLSEVFSEDITEPFKLVFFKITACSGENDIMSANIIVTFSYPALIATDEIIKNIPDKNPLYSNHGLGQRSWYRL